VLIKALIKKFVLLRACPHYMAIQATLYLLNARIALCFVILLVVLPFVLLMAVIDIINFEFWSEQKIIAP